MSKKEIIEKLSKKASRLKDGNKSLLDDTLRTIFEKALTGYYIILNGKFYFVNPAAVSFMGYKANELIGKNAYLLVHPEDRNAARENVRAILAGKRKNPYEFRIINKKGEIHWVVEVVVPIILKDRRAILGNSMDITQQKMAEQKLIESENIYKTIFETTGSMTMIGDEQKNICMLNTEFEKLTGFKRDDWVGKRSWTEYIHKEDLPRMVKYSKLRRINPDRVPKTYESRILNSQGQIKHILVNTNMIPGTKKHVSTAMDVTELKEVEEKLIRKSENLLELNTALKVLLNQRESDRKDLETNLLSNVKEFVLPYMEKIRKIDLDKRIQAYLDLLESNLKNILTPFSRTLSAKYLDLTLTEIEVANFIKDGRSSKEIAAFLNVSSSCVDIHRHHIRKKFGLARRANLTAFLKNMSP